MNERGIHQNNRTEHHTTMSELGFTIEDRDIPSLNAYQGEWTLTGEGEIPENYWVVTIDGNGHPIKGSGSPQQLLDRAHEMGWDPAYAAPYGCHVIGKDDGIELHEWLQDHRKKHISH